MFVSQGLLRGRERRFIQLQFLYWLPVLGKIIKGEDAFRCYLSCWPLVTNASLYPHANLRKKSFINFSSYSQIFTYTVGLVPYPLPSASALLLWTLSEELHSKGIYAMLPKPLSQLVGGVSSCLSGLLVGNEQGEWGPIVNRSSNDCCGKSGHHKGIKRWWLKNAVSKDQ